MERLIQEYGLPNECILKVHGGNKYYPKPADSQMQFDILDKAISKIRIVLLVQIGKEGWDCRSLTGVILSQEGDCPTNMVLQTSCRCLRQVDKESVETALIYLNDSNADKLNKQLQQQHHISIKEFTEANYEKVGIRRYDRTKYLKLPKIDFYQFKVNYETMVIEAADPETKILESANGAKKADGIIKTTDLTMKTLITEVDDAERGTEQATFATWLYRIVKGSFFTLTMAQLNGYRDILKEVFDAITYESEGTKCFSSHYDCGVVEANIRKAFSEKRSFSTKEELIPEEAALLNVTNFNPIVYTDKPSVYYPNQETVEKIILDDKGKLKVDAKTQALMKLAEETGQTAILEMLCKQNSSHPQKNHSFHYLPYRTDSDFEQTFLDVVLSFSEIETLGLEVYYNGDRAMTEFKIKCYKKVGTRWQYVGMYTPDFLIIQRKDNEIFKAVVVETKGAIYANDPDFIDKKIFMEQEFSKYNNQSFGYERFDYLYLEDTLPEKDRLIQTHQKICEFFKEG